MTVQEFKPRGSAAEEQQPSGDILSPSSEPLDNDKEQSAQVCYRGAPQDSENLLGRVLAGKTPYPFSSLVYAFHTLEKEKRNTAWGSAETKWIETKRRVKIFSRSFTTVRFQIDYRVACVCYVECPPCTTGS